MTAGKRVLLVDDESEIRDMIRDSLYALDLSFSDANNGLEALELLRAEHFDLVITDYNMPKMNGLQLVKEMQSAGFNIPTMWLTGRGTDALYKEACRYGVTDYIDKPFVLKTLQDLVRKNLELSPSGSGKRVITPIAANDSSPEEERQLLKDFLRSSELIVPESFLSSLKKDDIIEIYSFPEMKQLYANREFMRISSYTPEQMRSHPVPELFWRSDAVMNEVISKAVEIATTGTESCAWNVANHELIESLHPRRRTFEMHMRQLAPVFDIKTGTRRGWASTLTVDLIYEWPEEK